jgi:hypothetical protein
MEEMAEWLLFLEGYNCCRNAFFYLVPRNGKEHLGHSLHFGIIEIG